MDRKTGWWHRAAGIAAVSGALALAACASGDQKLTAPTRVARALSGAAEVGKAEVDPVTGAPLSYGQTAFLGLLFGDNSIGQQFPEFFEGETALKLAADADDSLAVYEIQHELLTRVAGADPGFFDRFGREVSSGDPAAVSTALDEASLASDGALADMRDESEQAWTNAGSPHNDQVVNPDGSLLISGDSVLVNTGQSLEFLGKNTFFYRNRFIYLQRAVYKNTLLNQNKIVNRDTYINNYRVLWRVRYFTFRLPRLRLDTSQGAQELSRDQVTATIATRLYAPVADTPMQGAAQ